MNKKITQQTKRPVTNLQDKYSIYRNNKYKEDTTFIKKE